MSTQTFTFNHVILAESRFRRDMIIDFGKDFNNDTDIKVTHIQNNQDLSVTLNLKFTSSQENKTVIESDVIMIGLFTIPENNDLPLDSFVNVNAPAIIFPFIREHLASLSMKAAINPILLQPINFVRLSEGKE